MWCEQWINEGVGGVAVFHDLTQLSPHFEVAGTIAGGPIGNDFGEAVDFNSVFGAIGPIGWFLWS